MLNYYLYLFEIGAVLTFLAILFKERVDKRLSESLILAMAYGLFLEIINTRLSQAYFYSKDFFLQIYDVPIAIGIGWAIIYYCAKKTAEKYRLKWWQEPFLMALIALSIDLAIDAVAIRLGFWSWRIPMDQEWFGVPYDNLVGWLAVVWTFSFFMNLSEPFDSAQGRQYFVKPKFSKLIKYAAMAISPILLSLQITIYVTLATIFSGKFTFSEIAGFHRRADFSYAYYPEVQSYKAYFFILITSVLVISLVKAIYARKGAIAERVDYFSLMIVFVMHLFFLTSIFTSGIYKELPILVAISLLMMFFHFAVSFFPAYISQKKNF